jgi:NAD(P)-dependent dehydrogenase (short-subunit alcohol dehydrogenase family)
MRTVLITGLEKAFDKELAAAFVQGGFKVYAMGKDEIAGVTPLPLEPAQAAAALEKENASIDIYADVSDERDISDNFNVRGASMRCTSVCGTSMCGASVCGGLNGDVMRKLYDANVTRPMAMLEAFLPFLEKGEGKRLCFLTSARASINETRETDGMGYKMAKAALHNFLQITRNVLAPKGYTIRAFDPVHEELAPDLAAKAAFNYFTRRRGIERGDERRDDEGNVVMRDAYGRQHSW